MDEYFVYVLLDTTKPGKYKYNNYEFDYEPFYIGKGKGRRIKEHFFKSYLEKDPNLHKSRKIKNIIKATIKPPIYLKLKEQIKENDSFKLEIELIHIIGRRDLKKGPLVNKTNGGDGLSGYKHTQDSIKKIRNAKVGNNNPFYGKHHCLETKNLISEFHKGNKNAKGMKHTNEWKREASKRHSKKWIITTPENQIIEIENLSKFCNDNNLCKYSMYNAAKTNKKYKNFICIKKGE